MISSIILGSIPFSRSSVTSSPFSPFLPNTDRVIAFTPTSSGLVSLERKMHSKIKFLGFLDCTITWMSQNDNSWCTTYSSFSSLFITGGTNLLLGPRLNTKKHIIKIIWLNVEDTNFASRNKTSLNTVLKHHFHHCFDCRPCSFSYDTGKQSKVCLVSFKD